MYAIWFSGIKFPAITVSVFTPIKDPTPIFLDGILVFFEGITKDTRFLFSLHRFTYFLRDIGSLVYIFMPSFHSYLYVIPYFNRRQGNRILYSFVKQGFAQFDCFLKWLCWAIKVVFVVFVVIKPRPCLYDNNYK